MAAAAGAIGVLLALLPLGVLGRLFALALGIAAFTLGRRIHRAASERGMPTRLPMAIVAAGAVAALLSLLILVSCQACSGDGERDDGYERRFRGEVGRMLERSGGGGGGHR